MNDLGRAHELVKGGRSIVAARVHSMTASLHCRLGREQHARASLRLLEHARNHALDEGDRRGLYGYGPRQQLMVEASYQLQFGSLDQALDHAGRAAAVSPPHEVIDRNIIRLLQATAQQTLRRTHDRARHGAARDLGRRPRRHLAHDAGLLTSTPSGATGPGHGRDVWSAGPLGSARPTVALVPSAARCPR